MFASAIRLCSQGLRDAPEVLLIWSLYNGRRVECGKRFYHNILKKTSCSKVNTLHGKYKIHSGSVKYAVSDINSAFSTTFDLEGNGLADAKEFLTKHSVTVEGNNPLPPVFSLENAGFPEDIVSVLRKNNIDVPTPIQSLSWPHALNQRDFVGISKTGSGKTLGFIVPAIVHIRKLKRKNQSSRGSLLALVLVPTRELALQVWKVASLFTDFSLRVACLYGGASREKQFTDIARGVDLCIATPGRLIDFLNANVLSLDRCSFLVLDEADRMLDMGFLPDLEKIISKIEAASTQCSLEIDEYNFDGLREKISTVFLLHYDLMREYTVENTKCQCQKQVLMWSATWPKEVKGIAEKFLSDYVLTAVGSTDLKPNSNIRQIVEIVNSDEKGEKLVRLLGDIFSNEHSKVLIFVETKFGVDALKYFLYKNRIKSEAIHSGKKQGTREKIMTSFRNGSCRVLIATALAARGLDVDNISHIINYDCPKFEDEYIHKIGRTGRHDKTGTAITFVTHADTNSAYLIDMLKEANQEVPRELYSIGRSRKISFNNSRVGGKSYKPFRSTYRNWD